MFLVLVCNFVYQSSNVSSLWCHGFVCDVYLWHFLLIIVLNLFLSTHKNMFWVCKRTMLRAWHSHIQWATLVTHHFLRAHIFSQKCWNRTFSMIIYLLTFYLFDDIEKKYRNHSCESFCYAKGNFDKNARLHVQSKHLYFLFAFCARHYPWWSLWQKYTKNNYFIQVNPLFSVVEICNFVTV